MSKTRGLLALALTAGLTITAGCSTAPDPPRERPDSSGPITLGLVVDRVGADAAAGEERERGARLAVARINESGGPDGRRIVLAVREVRPDAAEPVMETRDLLAADVRLVVGYTDDDDCRAAGRLLAAEDGLLVGLGCRHSGASLGEPVFQVSATGETLAAASARVAADSGLTHWQGLESVGAFGPGLWAAFAERLGPDATSLHVALPAGDAARPAIHALLRDLPENSAMTAGLLLSTPLSATLDIAEQGTRSRFFSRYGAVLNPGGDTAVAEALGLETPRLTFVNDYAAEAFDAAANSFFVERYRAAYQGRPGVAAYQGYVAVLALAAGIEAAGSAEPGAVAAALPGLDFAGPAGPSAFGADHVLQAPVAVWTLEADPAEPGGFAITEPHALEVPPTPDG